MSNQVKSDLREAIITNNLSLLQKIIEQSTLDLNTPVDLNGLTLLHFAVQNGRQNIVEFLCTKMNDINIKDTLGRTPLHYASAKGELGILKVLLASGANVNCQTIGGETALMKAITFNRLQSVKLLLRFGSDVTIINQAGLTSKELAILNKNNEIVEMIYLYEDIFYKLSLIVYSFIYLRETNRHNSLHRLTPEMIKQLTRYIIP